MANHTTGAQRYNKRMDEIFRKSNEAGHTSLHSSTEKMKGRNHDEKTKALRKKK